MNIAFCAAECYPFAKTGGLADVVGALPIALKQEGVEVSIFLPHYKAIDHEAVHLERINETVSSVTLNQNIQVFLIENEHYFNRDGIYGDGRGDFPDNLERFYFFSKTILDVLRQFDHRIDILHCHDWHTALIPVLLKEQYQADRFYKDVRSLLTIHNLAFQGTFSKEEYPKFNLPDKLKHDEPFEFYDQLNLLKAGLIYSDEISTVSPQYAKEIQTQEFGCGLHDVLQQRSKKVIGILNGVDYNVWDPANDEHISANYDHNSYAQGKSQNKKALQERLKLQVNPDIPVFGFVSRITHQKGFDLFLESFDQLKDLEAQFVIQGLGEQKYLDALIGLSGRYPDQLAVCFEFDESLAHQIYAGADMFLIPSNFEPCGLSQMISMRYGTIPVVYKTGGLIDTVVNFDETFGNGFIFQKYDAEGFVNVVQKAIEIFLVKTKFNQLILNAFAADFSWEHSAKEYIHLYKCLKSD